MRELLAPHQPIRYRAGDFVALWRCDEASGSLVDVTGSFTAAVASGTIGAAGGLFSSPAGTTGARTFSTSRATATGSTAARTALLGEWTISAWVKPTSITATAQVVVAYAGGNTLASLGLAANTGEPFVLWRRGTTDYTATANTGTTAGSTFHVAAVKQADPANAGRYRVTLYLNGVARGTTSNLLNADGGTTSPTWSIGTNGAGSQAFGGTLDDVAVLSYAASAEMVRDIYTRGVSPYDAPAVYDSDAYQVRARVLVEQPNGTRVDLTSVYGWDLLQSIDLDDDVDSQGARCSLRLVREVYDVNIAPMVASSAPNVDAGGQLLALNRRVIVETATLPDGASEDALTPWVVVFDGFVEGVDWGTDIVSVDAFDRMLALQDVWVEPDRSVTPPVDRGYGSKTPATVTVAVEGAMASLIADNVPATVGYVGGTPSLFTPTSPGWGLTYSVVPSSNNVAGVLEQWASEIGWLCRYRWDDLRKAYRLTFYDPERTRTWTSGDPTLSFAQVLDYSTLEVRRDDIRNVVEVEYGNAVVPANNDNVGQWERETLIVQDAASIAKYGRRYCRIGIGTNQEINDATQATRLAENVLSDLKDPKANLDVEVMFRHFLEVGDVVKFLPDGQRFDSEQAFAVVGVSHSLTETQRRTRLTLRSAAPVGRWMRWWDVIVTPGRVGAVSSAPPDTPLGVTYTPTLGGIRVQWTYPINAGARRYLETEIHRSAVSGFAPSQTTLLATVRGKSSAVIEQLPGAAQYVRLLHRDMDGNVGAPSAQLTTASQQLSIAYVPDEWRQAFHVRQTSGQSWSTSSSATGYLALANLTTVDLNTYALLWNSGLQRVEVQNRGIYSLSACVGLTVSQAPSVGVGLVINGALSTFASARVGDTPVSTSVSGTWTVSLTEGDVVQFALVADTGKTIGLTTLAARTYVSGALLFVRP